MLRIALGQLAPHVGDIDGNVTRILDAWHRAAAAGSDLVVFTELAVTGYPPEDLLLKPEFVQANLAALQRLRHEGPGGTVAVVGFVGEGGDATDRDHWDEAVAARELRNSAAVLADGRIAGVYNKWRLPNYGVFDEARYFTADDDTLVLRVAGVPVGVTVCEDLWTERGSLYSASRAGARVVVNLNASPYHRGKRSERERWVRHHATQGSAYVAFVNAVGGHDDVVFDGDSMLAAPTGEIVARGAQFTDDLAVVDLEVEPADVPGADLPGFVATRPTLPPRQDAPRLEPVAEVWEALVRATRDYCHRNGFTDAVVGLSGGIDSAVTAAVAAEALDPPHVTGVAMPSPHSSDHSLEDAEALSRSLGIAHLTIPIQPAMKAFDEMLAEPFAGTEPGIAEENIQARARGLVLMALSNKHGSIVLATGNKSEVAVGYATLYGDMVGGFAPLKDVPKLLVYELARHRNERGPGIPTRTLSKPPSAELRPGQLDEDSLPPYEVLDAIVAAYVEDDCGIADIVARGFDEAVVRHVVGMIDASEYKRRQAAPGPKITTRAFGRERRMPITNRWRS